jgi:UDP-N-acetylmuramyl pentapeptide phosphotransferase/UDP-N-acetylglucosamine-1-phosphate transferase
VIDWWPFGFAAICAGILVPLAIGMRSIGRDHPGAIQHVHHIPTSRLGGIVIVIACAATLAVFLAFGRGHWPPQLPLVLAAVPAVLFGLAEDLTRRVRPRYRMGAAVVSAMLASAFSGGIVPRLDLPLVDDLLKHLWFVLPLTWFMVAGACNAINLIDGAHGLAAGTALIMFGGIALAAGWSGDAVTLNEALVVMGAIVGFLAWNYPRGRVFLGDAGAYFIGFMYAELAIQLIARNSGLSAWYVIMLAGYPIVDTLFAMYRRGYVRRVPLMEPDALHLHSLVYRRVAMPIERRQKRWSLRRANARVAPRLWLHSALCFALAVLFHDNTPALWLGLAVYGAFYVSQYRALVRFRRKRAPRRVALVAAEHADVVKQSNRS